MVGGLSPEQLASVRQRLDDLFDARPLDTGGSTSAAVSEVARVGHNQHCFAVFASDCAPTMHTLKPGLDWQGWGSLAVSEAWLLQERVLAPTLGDALGQHIDYSPDHDAIVEQVNRGEQQLAILLKPFPLEPFREIVSAGQRLPPKSTFFYPKLPTGLVINQLSGTV